MSNRKAKELTKKEKNIFRKELIIFYYIVLLYIPNSFSFRANNKIKFEMYDSSIYLKVKGIKTGKIRILSSEFKTNPKEIYVNRIKQNNIDFLQDLREPVNNVTIIWNVTLESTSQMFNLCPDIIEIDLSNLDSSNIKTMNNMFVSCNSLININFTNFKTSKVTDMSNLFVHCNSLKSLDLSIFDTSNIKNMFGMFFGCYSLTSLDLSNFNTSKVEDMGKMFYQCSNLTSLDLSNFNTAKVTKIVLMFYQCSSLKYLFLTNFNSSQIISKDQVFDGCSSLEFINLKGFNLTKDLVNQIATLKLEKLTICDDQQINFSNLFVNSQKMICDNSLNDTTKEFKCASNNSISYNKHSCDICGKNNFFQLYNDKDSNYNNNNFSYIKCSYSNEGYYLDNIDFLYKPCYLSCKTCNKSGNDLEHNCLECKENYINETYLSNYKNCYKINDITNDNMNYELDDTLFNSINKISDFLTDDQEYSNTFNSEFTTDLISSEVNIITNSYYYISHDKNITLINNSNENYIITDIINTDIIGEINTDINNISESIENIIENLLNEINFEDIDNLTDKNVTKGNLIFILTSTKNQKNKLEKYITMDLCECENKLKKSYGISENASLYILQIISEEKGMKIPKLEYEIYYPLNNNNNLTKLNLTICKDIRIEISISVLINDTLDKYNPKSDYYNNICSKVTSESGTDICLKDRRNEFIKNNMSLCEENCELINYDYTNKKAKCSCEIKLKVSENFDIKFNKKDFFKSFIDIKNMARY